MIAAFLWFILSTSVCERVVSLAPNITEILFALHLDRQVIGVSRYCEYPPKVKSLPSVGGYVDPNFERMLSLRPSAVFLVNNYLPRKEDFEKLSLHTEFFNSDSISGILASIEKIGKLCQKENEATELVTALNSEMMSVQTKVKELSKVKTLVVVGTDNVGSLRTLYASGNDGFYNELILLAGGINVLQTATRSVAAVSLEGIVRLNPEVIIEIHPNGKDAAELTKRAQAAWEALPMIAAVKNKRIYVLTADFAAIPGPRFPSALKAFLAMIHPEVV